MNECSISLLVNLYIGLVTGIISYFLVQLLLKLFKPKVEISSQISESNSDNTYRIKVQNKSKRDIGDIVIKISYRSKVKGHYTYSVKDIPLLHSVDKEGNSVTARIKPAQLSGNREESAKDFFTNNPSGFIEIEMSYCDKSLWSFIWNSTRWSVSKRYPTDENKEPIIEKSIFVANSVEPVPLHDEMNRFMNC